LIKKKFFVPIHEKINLIGMLIGPKGMYHKMLEELSGCYMFIKGKQNSDVEFDQIAYANQIKMKTTDLKLS
jgi:rRNA processing protein Krr1/Pno1